VDIKDMGITQITELEETLDVEDITTLVEGEPDSHGNIVYANNVEEEIVILHIEKPNFKAKLIIVEDPSRVFLGVTDYKGSRGEFICDYLEKHNAVVGVNASGFIDTGGVSLGGQISGMCVSGGEYWGSYKSKYTLVGFDNENRLIVGGTDNWEQYNIRDGMQFRPTLILNGEKVVEDSAGWGLQPRTVIGQCENGVVLMLVVDGRQVGHSIGATMEDCADILLQYGAITAGACDGGSSSVIGYDGEVINKPSARDMPTGRYLPNAWLVARKSTTEKDK
jgi:exopolysaccharide biosynthesis protein